MVVYYSGTGNSRYCAELLAHRLDDELLDAFQYIKHQVSADLVSGKPWVFVCPTYAWRIPRIFERFLRSGSFSGSQDAYFVMTCGAEIGNAGAYLKTLCQEIGMHDCGVLEVVMPENYVAMFRVPEEKEADQILAAATPVLERAAERIAAGETLPEQKAGVADRIKSSLVNRAFYPLMVKDRPFYVTDDCVSCGKCAEACVMDNITMENGKPRWHGSCTHCMACICGCPKAAIEYGKKSQGKPRYQCKHWKENKT